MNEKMNMIEQLLNIRKRDLENYKKEYKAEIKSLEEASHSVQSFKLRSEINSLSISMVEIAECESAIKTLEDVLEILKS